MLRQEDHHVGAQVRLDLDVPALVAALRASAHGLHAPAGHAQRRVLQRPVAQPLHVLAERQRDGERGLPVVRFGQRAERGRQWLGLVIRLGVADRPHPQVIGDLRLIGIAQNQVHRLPVVRHRVVRDRHPDRLRPCPAACEIQGAGRGGVVVPRRGRAARRGVVDPRSNPRVRCMLTTNSSASSCPSVAAASLTDSIGGSSDQVGTRIGSRNAIGSSLLPQTASLPQSYRSGNAMVMSWYRSLAMTVSSLPSVPPRWSCRPSPSLRCPAIGLRATERGFGRPLRTRAAILLG